MSQRELSQVLIELHDGLLAVQGRAGMRLSQVEMTLPLELQPVFRRGGCVLLADFSGSPSTSAWAVTPSKLVLGWGQPDPLGESKSEAAP